MGYPPIPIGEFATVQSGYAFKSKDWRDAGVPVIRIGNVKEGRVVLDGCSYVSPEVASQAQRYRLKRGDIVISMSGRIGDVAMVRTDEPLLLNQRVGRFTITESTLIHPPYLYHSLRDEGLKAQMQAHAYGVAQPNISPTLIQALTIPVPDLVTQRKIVAILSAYDDLIENNLRRIKILEQMAQLMYREWFVNFRFPGHERVRIVDSPLGAIPKGWEPQSLESLLATHIGGDWGSEEPGVKETHCVRVIRGTDIRRAWAGDISRLPKRYIRDSSYLKRGLRVGDVVVENSVNASSRSVGTGLLVTDGILSLVASDVICASFCKLFRPKDSRVGPLIHLHLQYLRQEHRMEFYQHVATNGIANLQTKRLIGSEVIPLPIDHDLADRLLDSLGELTSSVCAEEVANLRRTRDLLLPRLMSGELDVSDLDIQAGEDLR